MDKDTVYQLRWAWSFWARPSQRTPPGDWRYWLIRCGRGWGKTRVGAEWVREQSDKHARGALVGSTSADIRDTMVEGPSGVLSVFPNKLRPKYEPSKRRITFQNGSTVTLYSAEEPERLRGPEHAYAWADELAAWERLDDTWRNLKFGLRVGDNPQAIITTTPKPLEIFERLQADQRTYLTTGSSYENRQNLADDWFEDIISEYEGSSIGRQEIYGELLGESEGALWTREMIERTRKQEAPELIRIVVAVDPPAKTVAECGIVVAGLGSDRHIYVLADRSVRGSPKTWSDRVATSYEDYGCDRVIAEVNNGGDMIEEVLRQRERNLPYRGVHASRGKRTRAEPIAALFESGKAHLVGTHGALEGQLCFPAGTLIETPNGLQPIEQVSVDDRVMTRDGFQRVIRAGLTGETKTLALVLTSSCCLLSTPDHELFVNQRFVPATNVEPGQSLHVSLTWANSAYRFHGEGDGGAEWNEATSETLRLPEVNSCYIERSGRRIAVRFQTECISTIETTILETILSQILKCLRQANISPSIRPEAGGYYQPKDEGRMPKKAGETKRPVSVDVDIVAHLSKPQALAQPSVVIAVGSVTISEPVSLYDLTVENQPEFYANGVLVHNCSWLPTDNKSPDRLDAMVWACTELMQSKGTMTRGRMTKHKKAREFHF